MRKIPTVDLDVRYLSFTRPMKKNAPHEVQSLIDAFYLDKAVKLKGNTGRWLLWEHETEVEPMHGTVTEKFTARRVITTP